MQRQWWSPQSSWQQLARPYIIGLLPSPSSHNLPPATATGRAEQWCRIRADRASSGRRERPTEWRVLRGGSETSQSGTSSLGLLGSIQTPSVRDQNQDSTCLRMERLETSLATTTLCLLLTTVPLELRIYQTLISHILILEHADCYCTPRTGIYRIGMSPCKIPHWFMDGHSIEKKQDQVGTNWYEYKSNHFIAVPFQFPASQAKVPSLSIQ
ncbi:hypothetical protein BKA61DRAFT_269022 [Leptodontidium sp. MPI-SDFR-AT-0119]|nr:hypothetical protein BKA61DRAFT_269022 [Leptodontidium sp. MPI-SDFR-AT-0119]